MVKYDDASWHSGGDFPGDSPERLGGTHIGLFLRWCFGRGWAGAEHLDERRDDVDAVINEKLSGSDFLFRHCDGKLCAEDPSAEGNAFAAKYYGSQGLYLRDYALVFDTETYRKPEEAHDYGVFRRMLDERLRSGVMTLDDL